MPFPATRVFDTPDILVRTLADTLLRQAATAIATHGRFHLVLAGGSTPRALYEELAAATPATTLAHLVRRRTLPARRPSRAQQRHGGIGLARREPHPARAAPSHSGRTWCGSGRCRIRCLAGRNPRLRPCPARNRRGRPYRQLFPGTRVEWCRSTRRPRCPQRRRRIASASPPGGWQTARRCGSWWQARGNEMHCSAGKPVRPCRRLRCAGG
jgi:6-phosphogluconolactonase/Glucosamine-6-phosphate isomerase/deaminase